VFKAMFLKRNRYFMVYVFGHKPQKFASIASVLRWFEQIGVTDTEVTTFQELN
jgi:hypothetical protein